MKVLLGAAVVVSVGAAAAACAETHRVAKRPATMSPQALRTCVDRWNQANMVGWGPAAANVAFRRPVAKEHSSIVLPRHRLCIVAIGAGQGTWTCVLGSFGAYWCPPLHEPTGPALTVLKGRNATIDGRGLLADRRYEVAEYRRQEFLARPGKNREGRQDAERDDAERHQRDQRRIAERAGGG
jgi:hypothetical protein